MTRIVVRASDTALAMDEVVRQLGAGAYILSTRSEAGGIVIEATTEPMAAGTTAAAPDFAAELALHMAPVAVTDPAWLQSVAAELCEDQTGPLAGLRGIFTQGRGDWPAERVVIFGPVTEDLVLVAVRLAASFRQARHDCLPELFSYPRRSSFPAAPLQDWAQRLGLSHRILGRDEQPPAPGAMPQLVILPPDSDATPGFAARWDSDLLCVLPWGLHPYRLSRQTAPLRGREIAACLTGIPDGEIPLPDDLLPLAAAGMQLRLLCHGAQVLQSLSLPVPTDLEAWARQWCARAGLACERPSKECAA